MHVEPRWLRPLGFEQIANVDDATVRQPGFPGFDPRQVKAIKIRVEDTDIRYLDTGADPTPTYGMLMATGDGPEWWDQVCNFQDLRFISTGAAATIDILYYGEQNPP